MRPFRRAGRGRSRFGRVHISGDEGDPIQPLRVNGPDGAHVRPRQGDYQDARAWTGDSCGAGAYEGDYRDRDRAVGHRLCFLYYEKGRRKSAIVWTDNRMNILSFAWREDTNLAALVDAWDTGVGPD